MLKQNDGLGAISARKMNRVFALDSQDLGGAGDGRKGQLPYTKAIAKNDTAWTLEPGAPVELTAFVADYSPGGGRVPGYYTAGAAAKPYLTRKRIGIVLEQAEPGQLFSIAIDGIVRANFDNSNGQFASLISDASGTDYQKKITSSPAMGFALILDRIASGSAFVGSAFVGSAFVGGGAGSALIRFGMCQAHRTGTATSIITASVPTAPMEFDVAADIIGGGTESVKAYTVVSNIANGSKLVLMPCSGIFLALKVC